MHDGKPGQGGEWLLQGSDDLRILRVETAAGSSVFTDGLAGHGHAVIIQKRFHLALNLWDAACFIEIFGVEFLGSRIDAADERDVVSVFLKPSHNSLGISPISWAMARVWITQLVEPPVAIRTMMALRMASGVRISREVMPFNTIWTAASPERSAARVRSL